MSGLARLGGASQDLSAAASLLGTRINEQERSADDLVSHPRFCLCADLAALPQHIAESLRLSGGVG